MKPKPIKLVFILFAFLSVGCTTFHVILMLACLCAWPVAGAILLTPRDGTVFIQAPAVLIQSTNLVDWDECWDRAVTNEGCRYFRASYLYQTNLTWEPVAGAIRYEIYTRAGHRPEGYWHSWTEGTETTKTLALPLHGGVEYVAVVIAILADNRETYVTARVFHRPIP